MTEAADRQDRKASSDSNHRTDRPAAAPSYDFDYGPKRHSPPSASERGRGSSELSRWLGEGLVRRSSAPPQTTASESADSPPAESTANAKLPQPLEPEAPTIRSRKHSVPEASPAATNEAGSTTSDEVAARADGKRVPALETMNGVGPVGTELPRDSIASVTMEQTSEESVLDEDDLAVLPGGGRKRRGAGGFLLIASVLVLAFVAVSQLSTQQAEEQTSTSPEPPPVVTAAPAIAVHELPPPAPTEPVDELEEQEDPEAEAATSSAGPKDETAPPKTSPIAKPSTGSKPPAPVAPLTSEPSTLDSLEFVQEKPSVGRLPDLPTSELLKLSDRQLPTH